MKGRQQSDVEARLSLDIDREVHDDAERRWFQIEEYIAHVFDGGDPARLPGDKSWYESPVTSYAERIVNKYREAQGRVHNPYHPRSLAFKLFDILLGDVWHEREDLFQVLRGSHVTTYIKPYLLRQYGYELEKREGTPVAYRIVSVD